jgi:hypothetical protein
VGSAAGVISGLSPGAEKDGEDLQTTYVPGGTMDIIIIIIILLLLLLYYYYKKKIVIMPCRYKI